MNFKQNYDKFRKYGCKNCGVPLRDSELCFKCSKLPEFKKKNKQKELTNFR